MFMQNSFLLQYIENVSQALKKHQVFKEYYSMLRNQQAPNMLEEFNRCLLKVNDNIAAYVFRDDINFSSCEKWWLINVIKVFTILDEMFLECNDARGSVIRLYSNLHTILNYPIKHLYLKETDIVDCISIYLIRNDINEAQKVFQCIEGLNEENKERIVNMLEKYQALADKYRDGLITEYQNSLSVCEVLSCTRAIHDLSKV